MKIDRESRIPIQHQLYESLKRWFIHDFTVDDTLPTEAVIAKRYAVSRGTVRNAMDRLVNDGLIERVPGRGTFLNKRYYIHLKDYHIGVILCDTDFFTNSIWEYIWSTHLGIMNGIVGKGLTYNISTEFISEEFFSSEDDRFYDGFIIWPYVHSTIFDRISKPYVILDYDIDVRTGFTLLAEDIARHDYEQLAFIGFTSGKRIEAVNDTLAEHGRPIVEDDHIVQCGGNPKEAYRSCSSLMNTSPISTVSSVLPTCGRRGSSSICRRRVGVSPKRYRSTASMDRCTHHRSPPGSRPAASIGNTPVSFRSNGYVRSLTGTPSPHTCLLPGSS